MHVYILSQSFQQYFSHRKCQFREPPFPSPRVNSHLLLSWDKILHVVECHWALSWLLSFPVQALHVLLVTTHWWNQASWGHSYESFMPLLFSVFSSSIYLLLPASDVSQLEKYLKSVLYFGVYLSTYKDKGSYQEDIQYCLLCFLKFLKSDFIQLMLHDTLMKH
jgi:hypothetical protein